MTLDDSFIVKFPSGDRVRGRKMLFRFLIAVGGNEYLADLVLLPILS